MDEVDSSGHRGGEADAIVGPVNVVVHGLGYGNDRNTLLMKPQSVRQRVVATDGDEHVDLLTLQDRKNVPCEVVSAWTGEIAFDEVGYLLLLHLGRIRA